MYCFNWDRMRNEFQEWINLDVQSLIKQTSIWLKEVERNQIGNWQEFDHLIENALEIDQLPLFQQRSRREKNEWIMMYFTELLEMCCFHQQKSTAS